MKVKRKTQKKCVYCGRTMKNATKDHVIARGFFPSDLPSSYQLVTYKCCQECHEEKNSCEEYVMAAVRLDGKSVHFLGGEELIGKTIRAFEGGNRGLVQKFNQSLVWDWQTFDGILQYSPVGIKPLQKEMRKFLEYLTRGMYFHMKKKIVPCDMKMGAIIPSVPQYFLPPLSSSDAKMINMITDCIENSDHVSSVGGAIFMCAMKTAFNENGDRSASMFVFAIRGRISITTLIPKDSQPLSNENFLTRGE